jgi:hypothetical protein
LTHEKITIFRGALKTITVLTKDNFPGVYISI